MRDRHVVVLENGRDRELQETLDLLGRRLSLVPAVQQHFDLLRGDASGLELLATVRRQRQRSDLRCTNHKYSLGAPHDLHGSVIYHFRQVDQDVVVAGGGEIEQLVIVTPER